MSVTSAGAPTLSVPRSSNEGNTRAAFTVAQATIWLIDMPNMINFDITFGKSTTPVVFDKTFQSVDNVSGQKPCLVAFVVEDAVHSRCVHMSDYVSALE